MGLDGLALILLIEMIVVGACAGGLLHRKGVVCDENNMIEESVILSEAERVREEMGPVMVPVMREEGGGVGGAGQEVEKECQRFGDNII